MGKLTISMAIFNSYVSHYQRVTMTNHEIVFDCTCNLAASDSDRVGQARGNLPSGRLAGGKLE